MKSIFRKFFDPGRPWLMACALASILACMFPAAEAQEPALVDTVVEQPAAPAPVSDETLRVQAMAGIFKEFNITIRKAFESINALRMAQATAQQMMPLQQFSPAPPAPVPEPPTVATACQNGIGPCVAQMLASGGTAVWEGTKGLITALAPFAGPVAQVHSTRVLAAKDIKLGEYSRDATVKLYDTFGTMNAANATAQQATSLGLVRALTAQATAPAVPTTQLVVNGGAGPVQVQTGDGTQTNASGNPVMQPPVVVVGTTGTTVSRGP